MEWMCQVIRIEQKSLCIKPLKIFAANRFHMYYSQAHSSSFNIQRFSDLMSIKFDNWIRGEHYINNITLRITYEYTGMGIQNRFISGLLHFDCDIITDSTMVTGAQAQAPVM